MRDVLPGLLVALPLAGAALVPLVAVLLRRPTRELALVMHAGIFGTALGLFWSVATEGPIRYALGGWPGPWGIELWLDGLSTLMAVLVAGMACFATVAQTFGSDQDRTTPRTTPLREGLLRGALLLLLGGLLGIVATRDIFNLFVFLEIASLAAYTLIASGGGRATVAAFRYLLAGTAAGSLYLFGVGFLYALTGTLNMDDLAAPAAFGRSGRGPHRCDRADRRRPFHQGGSLPTPRLAPRRVRVFPDARGWVHRRRHGQGQRLRAPPAAWRGAGRNRSGGGGARHHPLARSYRCPGRWDPCRRPRGPSPGCWPGPASRRWA